MFSDETSLNLEAAIDQFGLESVIMRLADIASEKSEHVADNWRDIGLSKSWDKAAGILQRTAQAIPEDTRGI